MTEKKWGKEIAEAVLDECRKALVDAYENAGISGVCAEGRWEVALGSISQIDIEAIIEKVLKANQPK